MEGGSEHYFLHEHPLIYNDDQLETWCCSARGLPLLSSPSYRCNDHCNFFLHNACRELPPEQNCVLKKGLDCFLALVLKPPNEEWECYVCGKFMCKINSIAYSGRARFLLSHPTIYVHPLCAPFPLEIKSRHDSHEHELVAMRREAQLPCDICGEEQKGLFFSCKEYSCDFFIHKLRLRRITSNYRQFPLMITFLLFFYSAFDAFWDECCEICNKPFRLAAGYRCRLCEFGKIHVNCAISSDKNTEYKPVQLPLEDEVKKSLFIHTMLNKKRIEQNKVDDKLSIEKYHEHPNLIFRDNINIDDDHKDYSSSLCSLCIQPVINSHPFYSCQEPGCDFLLHKYCADPPSHINLGNVSFGFKSLPARFKRVAEEFSLFYCDFCTQRCNGFGYEFDNFGGTVDVQCASFPIAIKHRLHHRQHFLVLTLHFGSQFACCSDDDTNPICYKCVSCDFKIHSGCALLPAKVNHKYDKHPLQLSKGRTNHVNDSKHCFCEICEDDIETEFWFYQCEMCDQLFHIKCIPSVGSLSKIKFGSTHVIPSHSSDHPMTLTRMLNIGDQRCGKCKRLISGFTDTIALQCSKCFYWIHIDCAIYFL